MTDNLLSADYDYIVVGGGLTGCTVASLLSKSPTNPKVLLIEAGPDPSSNEATRTILSGLSLVGSEYDYLLQTEPNPDTAGRSLTINAGNCLGGGSILNYGGWLRADAGDYDEWAAHVGDERWNNNSFTKLFHKIETFHDTPTNSDTKDSGGPMHVFPISSSESGTRNYLLREPVQQAFTELGVSPNPRRSNGSITGLTEFYENTNPQGLRQPSYKVYPLTKVQVLTNTPVSRVLFDVKNNKPKTITGVELSDGRTATAKKEVILCAGAYHTPKILLLSGIGPANILKEHNIRQVIDSPHVGQNLHDHFALFLAFRLRDSTKGYALTGPETPPHPLWAQNPSLFKYLPWDWVASESLPPSFSTTTTTTTTSNSQTPSVNQINTQRPLYEIIPIYCPPGIPGIPPDGTHIATSTMLLRPTSRGTLSLNSNNPSDPPKINTNFFSTKFDRDTLVYGARRTLNLLLGTKALADIIDSESPPGLTAQLQPLSTSSSDKEIEERTRLTGAQHAHPGGTAAMGSVVDTEGRVIGVEKGLRIADASILPFPVGGHPQATLYAVAEQIGEMVLQSH